MPWTPSFEEGEAKKELSKRRPVEGQELSCEEWKKMFKGFWMPLQVQLRYQLQVMVRPICNHSQSKRVPRIGQTRLSQPQLDISIQRLYSNYHNGIDVGDTRTVERRRIQVICCLTVPERYVLSTP